MGQVQNSKVLEKTILLTILGKHYSHKLIKHLLNDDVIFKQ